MLLALVAFVTGAAGVCAWTWMIVVRLKCPRCRRRESVIRIAGSCGRHDQRIRANRTKTLTPSARSFLLYCPVRPMRQWAMPKRSSIAKPKRPWHGSGLSYNPGDNLATKVGMRSTARTLGVHTIILIIALVNRATQPGNSFQLERLNRDKSRRLTDQIFRIAASVP
jgi:hypothetical protein